MSLVRLTEGQRGTAQAWREELCVDEDVWNELVGEGVFTPVRKGRGALLSLEFVGLIGLPDRLLACMPRVGVTGADPLQWLRRVLSVYFARESRRSREDAVVDLHFRDKSLFREIDALTTLLSLYAERGLHRRIVTTSTLRGTGAVDWSSTLARCEPLISNGQPIYAEPRRWLRSAETNEISRLQAAVTIWLAHKYDVPVPSSLREAGGGVDIAARLSPERTQFDLMLLRRERSITYLASDLRLLDALEAVVSGRREMAGVAGVKLFGTTSFALIWEDALRDLFGDESADASMGQANWYDVGNGELLQPQEARGRRLDLLVRHEHEVYLLDAKYHHPFPDVRPGWADIIKQVYYAESLVKDSETMIRNAFLLPRTGARLKLASLVQIEDAGRDFPPVEAWTLDPAWVFSAYGDGDLTRRAQARAAFGAARDEMAEVLGNA